MESEGSGFDPLWALEVYCGMLRPRHPDMSDPEARFNRLPDPFDSDDEPDLDLDDFEPLIGPPSEAVTLENMPQEFLETILTKYMGDEVFAKRFAECITMLRRKNADYSQGEQKGDRIAAFRRIARDINITMPQAWAVFCQKHWGAVMKYVKEGTVESEPIGGRINDIINYMVLLGAIIDDMESK
jgi:hypothetical protein